MWSRLLHIDLKNLVSKTKSVFDLALFLETGYSNCVLMFSKLDRFLKTGYSNHVLMFSKLDRFLKIEHLFEIL